MDKELKRQKQREYMRHYRASERGKERVNSAHIKYWKRRILEVADLTDEQRKILEEIV